MKIYTLTQTIVAVFAAGLCTTALGQNPRALPPVNQPGSQFAPKAAQSPSSGSNAQSGGQLSAQDKDFMKKAAQGGMEEVEMGKMAEQHGQSADVKAFGKRMVTDHSKANSELMALASKKGVQLGNKAPKAEKMSGPDFDKKYMADMVKDHEKDLAEFQREASNGSDPDVKAFAAKTAKIVQKHLELAKSTQGKLK